MNIFEYEDFLRISDEIEMNRLSSKIDMMLIANERNMNDYTKEISFNKTMELMAIISELQDLKNKAVAHNSKYVVDMCEVYIVDAEYQMGLLRKKYMFGE